MGTRMGKAADNEQIKLKATFYNNVAVGLVLAGAIIPYLSLIAHLREVGAKLDRLTDDPSWDAFLDMRGTWYQILAFVAAIVLGHAFRMVADREVQKLAD